MKPVQASKGLVLVLATVALGASCSSVIKGQSAALDRGREDDDAKPFLDLSKYVKSREETPPANAPRDLLANDPDVQGRKLWQNPKVWPRNYKFAVAIAPLREEFRRSPPEGNDPNGEPRSSFSARTPDAPIDDSEGPAGTAKVRRARAALPPVDSLFGFDVTTTGDRHTAAEVTSSSTGRAPGEPSVEQPLATPLEPTKTPEPVKTPEPAKTPEPVKETPKETPAEPADEDRPPRRVGMKDDASSRHFAATGAEDPGPSEPGPSKSADLAVEERSRHIRDVSSKEGMNFSIDSDKFQDRMKQVLDEFRMFENVDPIKYGDDQKSLEGLFRQADARKDDFLLVCSLRRNKVSYGGLDLGPAALDTLLEVLFAVPEFWSPIHREIYECDVELYVKLYDVRSRHVILDQTFEGHDVLVLKLWQRGYHPLRNYIWWLGDIDTEGLYASAGENVRPGAWLDMEIKLLDSFQNTVKAALDDERFTTETNRFHDLTNGGVRLFDERDVRQLALVVGITEYGPAAQPKLAEWAAGSSSPQKIDEAQKELVSLYDGQPVKLGTRPYAESDASRIGKELLNRAGALESSGGLSDASVTANLATLLGKDATLKELRAAFRQIARARREDRVFIYLNGETLVMDDPASADAPPKNYFLPYDIDLAKVEQLYATDRAAAKAYLDEHALGFDWIEACFYRDSAQDHIYLQSRHALFVVDCSFPGQFTRDRFCPLRARLVERVGVINALPGRQEEPPRKDPDRQPEKQPEKAPEKQPEKAPETVPPDEEERHPKRVGFVNPSRFLPTTVLAQAAGVGSEGVGAVSSKSQVQYSVTTGFLERIAQGGEGRFVVLAAGPGETTLDIPAVKLGGFVYYFTQFLDPVKKARFDRLKEASGAFVAKKIVDYATDRLESESRQAGRPQHVLSFGDKDREYKLLGKPR